MKILRTQTNIFQMLFIVLFGLLVFSNTAMINTFHYDDDLTILHNESIRSFDLPQIWSSFRTRFIPGLTFAANYAVGGLDPRGYHLVNVLIHLLNALLVWGLAKELIKIADNYHLIGEKFSDLMPFLTALIFLVHPVQTEAVNFVTQRYVLLAALFYLTTLLLYVKARVEKSRFFYAGAIITCVLAMFCKEISFTLPFMIFLVEFFFFRATEGMIRKRMVALAPFFVTLFIIPVTLLSTHVDMPGTTRIAYLERGADNSLKVDITKAASEFSRKEYFLTELNVLRTYMRLLVLPVNQNLDYDYPIYKSFKPFKIYFSLFLFGFFFYLAYRLFNTHRVASFAIVWFFLLLSVESTIIPIAHVIAEYRLYIAVVGFAFLLVLLCAHIAKDRHGFILSMFFIIAVFSLAAHLRNTVWLSRTSLWEDTVRKSPYKPRPNVNLGKLYTRQGRLDEAEKLFLTAIQRGPQDARHSEAFTNLGVVYVKKGEVAKAIEMQEKAIALNPNDFISYFNLGIAYSRLADFDKEIEYYKKALVLNPKAADVIYSLGLAYLDNQDPSSAREQAEKLKKLGYSSLAEKLDKNK